MRPLLALSSLALATATYFWIRNPAPTEALDRLRVDPANAYRWADLGDDYLAKGKPDQAKAAYRRARELAPQIPPIWVRDVNLHLQLDDPEAALASAARVLDTVPDYDPVLFTYFDSLINNPTLVLRHIRDNPRATASYLQHLQQVSNLPAAKLAWTYVKPDDKIASSYIDYLLRAKAFGEARQTWADYLGPRRRGDYPERNALFNGSFATPPTGSPLDWRIQPSEQFETVLDQGALKITFKGNENVSYENVSQTTVLLPGPHRLRARIRLDNITTNEGIRIRVFDPENPSRLDFVTESLTGTTDWKQIDETFTAPQQSHLATLQIVRRTSRKFDSKISGTVWFDDLWISP